jgi:AcrR family transcriptional regulator
LAQRESGSGTFLDERRTYHRLKPGPGRSPDVVKTDQRERLYRAMTELVAAEGYSAVTVRRLTKLARISSATFYAHFNGTDECFVKTYMALMERITDRVAAARTPLLGRDEQAARSVGALLQGIFDDPSAGQLVLIDIFAGGPAAIGPVKAHEGRLGVALRGSLSRRDLTVSPEVASWIVAGVLHCARAKLATGASLSAKFLHSMGAWAAACLEEPASDLSAGARPNFGVRIRQSPRLGLDRRGHETGQIINAVLKLATADGYWKLSVIRTSRAAGLTGARFKKHFQNLDDAYLATIGLATRKMFSGFGNARSVANESWEEQLRRNLIDLVLYLETDQATAGLVFTGVLEPGVRGLTFRDRLIDQIAARWLRSFRHSEQVPPEVVRASVAAIWGTIAARLEARPAGRLSEVAPTLAFLTLVPITGGRAATRSARAGARPPFAPLPPS